MADDIAIIGMSFKLAQGVDDPSTFWQALSERKNLMTQWPEDRVNLKSFYASNADEANKLHSTGSHFLSEDPGVFDAPFFSITAREAAAMDPQQRWALETAYHAFENAGVSNESLMGSRCAVYAASMSDEYTRMLSKDPDNAPPQGVIGTSPSILPNRISWYFNLTGPSVHIDTACSGGMVAVDLAVQALRSQEAGMALVCSPNLILGPEGSVLVSNLGFLSPDSVCYSFDRRANGYSRGEGVIAMVLKPVSEAVKDNDTIRAVIRSSGTNQDGKTVTLTQPNPRAQETLIRHVYEKAGLDFASTHYVEAHGTGTPVGDPIELQALGSVFGDAHSRTQPLYVGSVKANIGHLEGCSGLAGMVKAILMLEKGEIPPNALFEEINPKIDVDSLHICIPVKSLPWPCNGLRRISVNSFGFGGTNAHVILDDACHYLKSIGIRGNHCTAPSEESMAPEHASKGVRGPLATVTEHGERLFFQAIYPDSITPVHAEPETFPQCRHLLIFSAANETAIDRVIAQYKLFLGTQVPRQAETLHQLAYTLSSRRTKMLWRTFAIIGGDEHDLTMSAKPVRATTASNITFIFTGQGAQYVSMGASLRRYPIFRDTLCQVNQILHDLGCSWIVEDALSDAHRVGLPEFSQPLCTAIQIALVHLLGSFNIRPRVVIGHSSGEIAAAYAAGALSLESAMKVAYFRGKLAAKLGNELPDAMAMLSVSMSENEANAYLREMCQGNDVQVACVNSPSNCTLSGRESIIDTITEHLGREGKFARKLQTGLAYHTPVMDTVSSEYFELMGTLSKRNNSDCPANVTMFSSVTGQAVFPGQLCTPQYWVQNLVSPVQFSRSVLAFKEQFLVAGASVSDFIEIGPHPALRRSVLETLEQKVPTSRHDRLRYLSTLHRSKSDQIALLELVGWLFISGHSVSVDEANAISLCGYNKTAPLYNCPPYPFDHSQRYWSESRLSRDYRLRESVHSQLLGERFYDCSTLEPRWRKMADINSIPWAADHIVTGMLLLPGTCLLVMAIEAAKQAMGYDRQVTGFQLRDVNFLAPALIDGQGSQKTELMTRLRPQQAPYEKEARWSNVTISSLCNNQWTECFQSSVRVEFEEQSTAAMSTRDKSRIQHHLTQDFRRCRDACKIPVDPKTFYKHFKEHGIEYGETFRGLEDIFWDGGENSMAKFNISASLHDIRDTVHPAVLDSAWAIHSTPTSIPSQIRNVWISAAGWKRPSTTAIHICSKAQYRPGGREAEATIHGFSDSGSLMCSIKTTVDLSAKNLIHGIQWKPHMRSIKPDQMRDICKPGEATNADLAMSQFRDKLDKAITVVLRETESALNDDEGDNSSKELSRYIDWMRRYVASRLATNPTKRPVRGDVEPLLQELEEMRPSWRIFSTIARNLTAILRGRVDPLSLLFDTGLAEALYVDVFHRNFNSTLHKILDLASHETPTLNILEIGAGTGSMTSHMLSILLELEVKRGSSTFSNYVYTDISHSFFENAKTRFETASTRGRMEFKRFDVEQQPESQGILSGQFDLVVVANVLHATANISSTLHHINHLLKAGGKLVFVEVIANDRPTMNFAFGVLPGWWRYTETWRQQGPLLDENQWDMALKENGFTGNDLCVRDFQASDCHLSSMIITTKKVSTTEARLVIVISFSVLTSQQTARAKRVGELTGMQSCILNLEEIHNFEFCETDVVVSLVETDSPFLADISNVDFAYLKHMLKHISRLLWVSCTSSIDDGYPFHGLMNGFLRSVRSETVGKKIVTLAIEDKTCVNNQATYITDAINQCFLGDSSEIELVVRGGMVLTARAVERTQVNDQVKSLMAPQLAYEAWSEGPRLKICLENRGMLDTIQFQEDTSTRRELQSLEVEIEMKAWGLSFRDVFVGLGRIESDDLGYDGSGRVTRVGSACERVRPGDHVCLVSPSCMRTYTITHEALCITIPNSVSFERAASVVAPGITAYHSLISVAKLQKHEKILIHSAAGSTGQMALWVAKMIGAEIFATVGHSDKKDLLVSKFDIPDDHIFYSRDTTFKSGIINLTNGYGVDVVLNSLSGDGLRTSWECLAPLGRFVELGKTDIMFNSSLPMAYFAGNISFTAVDLHHLAQNYPDLVHVALSETIGLVSCGLIKYPQPLHIFGVSQVESAFRYMQSGRNSGRIVVKLESGDIVPKRLNRTSAWMFQEDSTYIIAGGTGGIGRRIARWMVQKGARYIILPSRLGGSSKPAEQLVSELRQQGVNIIAPKCDVSSRESLGMLLAQCAETMPPIRGCINAAMVLQDAIFDNMAYDQWSQTITSKVDTSWNLHCLLPQTLDFYIMLSSLSGIYGSPSQANYAAGCTFQDSLARYRVRHNLKTITLDIGWVRNVGIIAENEQYQRNRSRLGDMGKIEDTELLSVLDVYCDPERLVTTEDESQVLLGATTPRDAILKGQDVHPVLKVPLFSGFYQLAGDTTLQEKGASVDPATLFRQADNSQDQAKIVVEALINKLSISLSVSSADIDVNKALSDYGVDSLMAVELQNWIAMHFKANVAVFDIMGGRHITTIGDLVVQKTATIH
ncbi:hypothetical protein F4777DRAFT_591503 [Nemania sp. FL0916]|nr:hypothetical protein F4777DRAFT_591503 [Nemania sp. FL0916]